MKHPISEVVFPLYGNIAVEAYAWSKELARLLKVPFIVIGQQNHAQPQVDESIQQLLEGDGYYYAHYTNSPPKTKVFQFGDDFVQQIVHQLQHKKGTSIIIVPTLLNSDFYYELLTLKQHILILIPSNLQKVSGISEFDNILQQIALHHLPFDLFNSGSHSFIHKVKQNIQSLLKAY